MRWQLIVVAVAASAGFGLSQPVAGKSDQEALQGVWRVVGGEMKGMPLPDEVIKDMDVQLTVKGNIMEYKSVKITVKGVAGGKTETTKTENVDSGTFKLDPSKQPKHIDIVTKKEGKTMRGIYELNGDEFKVCLDEDSKDRPTEFKSKADSPSLGVMVFKRVKK